MDRLEHAWMLFTKWPPLARRAAMAVAFYLLALLAVWLYSEGLQSAGKFLFAAGSVGFFFAIGGWYILRGAFFLLVWWLRIT